MTGKAKPIPKAFLCDKAVLLVPSAERSDFFTQGYTEIALENVRIERRTRIRLSKGNTVSGAAGVLYFDCANSKPKNTLFTAEMRLRTDSGEYRITEVDEVRDGAGLHHCKAVFR